MATKKLTPTQQNMLDRMYAHGQVSSMGLTGTHASAWHETAEALVAKGLAKLVRNGNLYKLVRPS